MTRLIDADALLEALNSAWEDNVLSTLGDCVSVIKNAPTIQREGWVSVPIDPTEEMIREALDCQEHDPEDDAKSEVYYMYKAMIQAAPTDTE